MYTCTQSIHTHAHHSTTSPEAQCASFTVSGPWMAVQPAQYAAPARVQVPSPVSPGCLLCNIAGTDTALASPGPLQEGLHPLGLTEPPSQVYSCFRHWSPACPGTCPPCWPSRVLGWGFLHSLLLTFRLRGTHDTECEEGRRGTLRDGGSTNVLSDSTGLAPPNSPSAALISCPGE